MVSDAVCYLENEGCHSGFSVGNTKRAFFIFPCPEAYDVLCTAIIKYAWDRPEQLLNVYIHSDRMCIIGRRSAMYCVLLCHLEADLGSLKSISS